MNNITHKISPIHIDKNRCSINLTDFVMDSLLLARPLRLFPVKMHQWVTIMNVAGWGSPR